MPLSASAPQISENMGQIERTIIHHSHGWMDGCMDGWYLVVRKLFSVGFHPVS
jgi:hypothetical protein